MGCKAHKHRLPRFYAFCCISGIFPTALMRSLRPCRVGDKSPTLLGFTLSLPLITVIPAQAGIHRMKKRSRGFPPERE